MGTNAELHHSSLWSSFLEKARPSRISRHIPLAGVLLLCLFSAGLFAAPDLVPNLQPFTDPSGAVATFSTSGDIDKSHAFFQPLGTNGRSCATCHQPDQGFALSAAKVQAVWSANTLDPLFDAVDGANCPSAAPGDLSTRNLVFNNGLIRVFLPLPQNPEFTISVLHDPTGCAITTDTTGRTVVSVYRRPLPTTNLTLVSSIMDDGRESVSPLDTPDTFAANLAANLKHQAATAVLVHAEGSTAPGDTQLADIVALEMGLSTAQVLDNAAGDLSAAGATGGASSLQAQLYYPGINDAFGKDPKTASFNPAAMTTFTRWASADPNRTLAQTNIAAGEELFNGWPLVLINVRGLNDNPDLHNPSTISGTCTTCHDAPNAGSHSLPLLLDTGISHTKSDAAPTIVAGLGLLNPPDLPVYLLTCPDPQNPGHIVHFQTSDPGRALITGLCTDINRLKVPTLRGLAARAPYFHNGSAATLTDVVNFYNLRFQMGLSEQQKAQLVAFLNSL